MSRVIVHIDTLVLRDFRTEDQHAIAAGLRRELGHVFADPRAVSLSRAAGDAARLQVGRLPVAYGSKPQHVGEQVALGIGREIRK